MQLSIAQSCPSCGAQIELAEDDRLIRCSFCGVKNFMVGSIGRRYVLPAMLSGGSFEGPLVYAPYLRFKGSIFYLRNEEVKHKIVDTTRLGIVCGHFPASLGVRPQAMKIKPVVASTPGKFVLQSVPTKKVFVHASMVTDIFADQKEAITYHRAFIGETLSRIYQPCYLKEGYLRDAVSHLALGKKELFAEHLVKTCSSKASWEPQFISTSCPECGGLLSGERDSLVLQCTNCQLLCQEQKRKFVAIDWKVMPGGSGRARYLPFWQVRFSQKGSGLKSFADFLHFTNQPVVVGKKQETRPLSFWIPAFKLHPKAFLQLASRITVAQERIPAGETRRLSQPFPVTLDRVEGAQAIKSVLGYATVSREKKFPLWPALQLEVLECRLVYLPFISQPHDLVQVHTRAVVQTAAIRHGRGL